ncbi:hypothetical protein AKJ16_DCAP15319 [Drosera capensis]
MVNCLIQQPFIYSQKETANKRERKRKRKA